VDVGRDDTVQGTRILVHSCDVMASWILRWWSTPIEQGG